MLRLLLLGLLSLLLLTTWSGCKKKTLLRGDSGLTVFPEGGSPGITVRITSDRAAFAAREDSKVDIGGTAAPIVRVVSDTEAEVQVPKVGAGETRLTVTDGKNGETSSAHFTVLPARAQQLVLHWKDGRIELVATHATAGEPSGDAEGTGEPLLFFELFNAAGGLIYTGAIPHPAQRRNEVFEPPEGQRPNIHRERMSMSEATFAVKVPNVPGRATIKFFEGPPGSEASNARQDRKQVGEITVEGGGAK
jgi:hypothetical protein